jgi:MFS family permease
MQIPSWLFNRSLWWPAALWFNFWFQRNLFSIFAPLLIRDLGLTYTQIGIVESGVLGTSAIGYIAAGHFVRESSVSTAFKISLLIEVAASALSGLSGGLFQLVIFQSIQGFVEGLIFVGVVLLISGFKANDLSTAYGAFESVGNLGWFLALGSGGLIGVLLGWRLSYIFLSIPILGLLPFKIRVTQIDGRSPVMKTELGFLRKLDFWLFALPLTLFFMNWYAVWTFAPSFLVTRGFSIEEAGFASALAAAFSVPAPFIMGLLIGRARPIRLSVTLLTLTTVTQILLAVSRGKLSIIFLLVAIGILQASTSPTLFVLLSELVSTLRLPTISGWSLAIGYWAALLGPVVFGNIADTASFSASFSLFAILNVVCIVAMLSNGKRKSGLLIPH